MRTTLWDLLQQTGLIDDEGNVVGTIWLEASDGQEGVIRAQVQLIAYFPEGIIIPDRDTTTPQLLFNFGAGETVIVCNPSSAEFKNYDGSWKPVYAYENMRTWFQIPADTSVRMVQQADELGRRGVEWGHSSRHVLYRTY